MSVPYPGAFAHRVLGDGRVVVLYQMLFTWRVTIGPDGEGWYDDFWCYPPTQFDAAHQALTSWDGNGDPPDGWIKHGRTGRRRPDGDPTREYIER